MLISTVGLDTPEDCRVYIMTSWLDFMFRAATWPWKIYLALSLPLWTTRVRKTWPLAGGWAQKFGKRQVIGVKPPRLLKSANREMGDQIFVRWDDLEKEVQSITCHELTHAFTAHLKLPSWLNEGLAMNLVDRYFQEPTVRPETLELLATNSEGGAFKGRKMPGVDDRDSLLYLYARGYWITRYIEETDPGLLKTLLGQPLRKGELVQKLANAYGMGVDEFWGEIDRRLVSYFG
jgi:hypothetical protein